MGRDVNTEGLSIICSGLGIADEDDNGNVRGYTKTEYCLGMAFECIGEVYLSCVCDIDLG